MLIIWGFKARFSQTDVGHFHCPREGGDRGFARMQARRWFTFFWIPLIPLKVLGEFIRCAGCGAEYDPQVLELPTTAHMQDQLTSALRHVVVAMVHADGEITEEELEAGVEVLTRFGLQAYTAADLHADLRQLTASDLETELSRVAGMMSPEGHETVLQACLMLAAADGHIDEEELKTIIRASRSLGMSPAHVRGVLAEIADERSPAG